MDENGSAADPLIEEAHGAAQEEYYRQALDSGNSSALRNYGQMLAREGQLDEAEVMLREALGAGGAEAGVNLSDEYVEMGAYDRAESVCLAAIEAGIVGAHVDYRNLLDDYLGRRAVAEKQYREAIAAVVEVGLAYYNLGVMLEQQGRREEARTSYEEARAAGYEEVDIGNSAYPEK